MSDIADRLRHPWLITKGGLMETPILDLMDADADEIDLLRAEIGRLTRERDELDHRLESTIAFIQEQMVADREATIERCAEVCDARSEMACADADNLSSHNRIGKSWKWGASQQATQCATAIRALKEQ